MPTRIIRDGILTSPRINLLSESAELFYRRLMSVVDDHGRYFADTMLLMAAAYPRRLNKITEEAIASHLAECRAADLLTTYAVEGQEYLQLSDFGQRVQAKSKFPDPTVETEAHGNPPCSTVESRLVGVGVVVGDEGGKAAPTSGRKRSPEQTIADWTASLDGADAIPPADPVFDYADKIQLPREFLALAWSEFEARSLESGKKYKDWRSAFRKCVRENWYRLWWEKDGSYSLTTAGIQAQRAAA